MRAISRWGEKSNRTMLMAFAILAWLMALQFSHFTTVILFALCASVVFAITLREEPREQMKYGAFCFASFLGATIVVGWIMYLINPR